jgi:hypothetical protein
VDIRARPLSAFRRFLFSHLHSNFTEWISQRPLSRLGALAGTYRVARHLIKLLSGSSILRLKKFRLELHHFVHILRDGRGVIRNQPVGAAGPFGSVYQVVETALMVFNRSIKLLFDGF